MIGRIRSYFQDGHERSVKAKKNILGLFFLRIFNTGVSYILLPLCLAYLSKETFGVWLTISSFLAWFAFFDFGLGNGLRNKFAESVAQDEHQKARVFVSTTFALIALIATGILVISVPLSFIIDWQVVFQFPDHLVDQVRWLMVVVFAMFAMQFVFQLIKTILVADQKPALAGAVNTVVNVVTLASVGGLFLTHGQKEGEGSILLLGTIITGANLLVHILATLYLFSTQYKKYRPSFALVDFSQSKDLLNLGVKFFLMHVASLVVVATDNMIISHATGPADVTPYQVAYKYFNFLIVVFTIFTTPFWSAFTDAYAKKDMDWIRRTTKKVMRIWFVGVGIVVVMLLLSDIVIEWWVGFTVPFELSLLMAVWGLLNTGLMIYSYFLSGVGKVKLSLYHSIIVMILNIPLSWYFAVNLDMGSTGVILASCICIGLRVLFQPLQYHKIINGTASGIWDA